MWTLLANALFVLRHFLFYFYKLARIIRGCTSFLARSLSEILIESSTWWVSASNEVSPSAGRERGESTRNDGRRRVGENGSIRYRMRKRSRHGHL